MADEAAIGYLKDLLVLRSIEQWDRLRISASGRLEKESRTAFQGARRAISGDGRDTLQTHLTRMVAVLTRSGADTTPHARFNDVREGLSRLRVTTYNQDDSMVAFLKMIEDELAKGYADKTRPAYRRVLLCLGVG